MRTIPRSRLFWISLGLVISGSAFIHIPILHLQNLENSKSVPIWSGPSRKFTIQSINSIYDAPVLEEFSIERGEILLQGIRCSHPGVWEYYGFDSNQDYQVLLRRIGKIETQIGMWQPQILTVAHRHITLQDLGEKGDRLVISVTSMSVAEFTCNAFQSFTDEVIRWLKTN